MNDIAWSPFYPDLVAVAYSKDEQVGREVDGLVIICWDVHGGLQRSQTVLSNLDAKWLPAPRADFNHAHGRLALTRLGLALGSQDHCLSHEHRLPRLLSEGHCESVSLVGP